MRILDLQDPKTWRETFEAILNANRHWEHACIIARTETDRNFVRFIESITCERSQTSDRSALELRDAFVEILTTQYTHVVAYHSARPVEAMRYLEEGIRPSNPEDIIQYACELFHDEASVRKTISDIGNDYLAHNRGKVGLFLSKGGALRDSHYLKWGSELLQCIANRIGEHAQAILSRTGQPTLFQCAIPVAWLDAFTSFPMIECYAHEPPICLLYARRDPHYIPEFEGGFMLCRAISPEQILNHFDMSDELDRN
jgi:hypothetical protein